MPTKTARQSNPERFKKCGPLISDERLREIYAAMLRCRMLGERAQMLAGRSKLPIVIGHEAAAVAVTVDLHRQDTVAPPPDDLILAYLKGVPAGDLLRKRNFLAGRHGHAAVNLLIPVSDSATRAGIAAGIALANLRKKTRDIVVAWIEDAPVESGWAAALEFAASHALPMVYVWQSKAARKRKTAGIPAVPVDGNDAVAVYRVAQEAIARARDGVGPTIIECRSWPPALSSSRHTEDRRTHDPIFFMEKYLTGKGLFTPAWKNKLAGQFNRELDAAAALARAAHVP